MTNSNRSSAATKEKKSRRRSYLVCGFLVLIAALIFFLPAILVNTPLKQTALNWATADLNGSVEIDRISAGWLTPIKLENAVLRDSSGAEVVTVNRVTMDQTLFGLAMGNYGSVTIEGPAIDLSVRPDGSNLEDILANYMAPAESNDSATTATPTSSELPQMNVLIKDGVVGISSSLLPDRTIIEKLNAKIQLAGEAAMVADIGFQNQGQAGSLQSNIVIDPGQNEILAESIELSADSSNLALAAFAPLLTRVLGPANIAGTINGNLSVKQQKNEANLEFSNFEASQVAFIAPDILGSDQFSARKITASGRLNTNFKQVFADQLKAESEFARLTANGEFDFEQLSQLATGDQLPNSNFQIDSVVDLAQITAMLPETTHIREGVQMNSGLLQVTATARNENGSPRLIFNADAASMDFVVDGRAVSWHKPLRAVAVAAVNDGQLTLQDIRLESDFLNVNGNASLTAGQLNIEGDLNKVINQLGQVVDTGDLAVAGIANGNIKWQTSAEILSSSANQAIPVQLTGNVKITNPKFEMSGLNPWQEKEIDLAFNAAAIVNQSELASVNSGTLTARIGAEAFNAVLKDPIQDVFNTSKYQFDCLADGSLAKWLAQARNFAEFPEFFCDGQLKSQFLLTVNSQALRVNQLQFESSNFQFDGFSLNMSEPKVTGRGNIKYDLASGLISFNKLRVSSSAFAANAEQLDLDVTQKILADGEVSFRADANRASNWIGLSMPGDSIRWDGNATGKMTFKSDGNHFGGDLAMNITEMKFFQPTTSPSDTGNTRLVSAQTKYAEVWREPDMKISSTIAMSDDFNNLQLSGTNLRSKTTDIRLNGSINDLANSLQADLQGQWKIDWDAINRTASELAGEVVEFSGTAWQPLQIKGPLYSQEDYQWIPAGLAAVAVVAWDQANVYDIPLGNNQINVRIDQALANISSSANNNLVDRIFGMQPVVDLRVADPVVYMNSGKILDQWAVTNEDGRTWLKYAAPLIADATSAEGKVSASLEGAAIPVFDPMKSSAKGTIEVHELTVGAGPMVQQLIPLVDQIRSILKPDKGNYEQQSWLQLKPQQLPFTVQDGRVHHSNFEINYKNLAIRTTGSVGFDQTLSMVAEIPIDESWLGTNKVLARMAGKSISIPIGGTLSKPVLDRRAVTQLGSQLLKESALGAAQEKVQQEVGELQNKAKDKIDGFQNKLNDKFKSEVEDKLQNELQNGLQKLFGGGKQ